MKRFFYQLDDVGGKEPNGVQWSSSKSRLGGSHVQVCTTREILLALATLGIQTDPFDRLESFKLKLENYLETITLTCRLAKVEEELNFKLEAKALAYQSALGCQRTA